MTWGWEEEKEWDFGNFRGTDRELYSDYSEISPWNNSYLKRFKRVSKPTWFFLSGTMPDLHHFLQSRPMALAFFSFWRSLSMWLGISNPFLGISIFVGVCLGEWPWGVVYVLWAIFLSALWSWYLGVPAEFIYNGLYPSQGALLGFLVHTTNTMDDQESQLYQLALLIPVTLFNLMLFQALGSFLIRHMRVTPMFIAPAITGLIFRTVKIQSTYLFNSPETDFINLDDIGPKNKHFFLYNDKSFDHVTGNQFVDEFLLGMSYLVFSTKWQSIIPVSIGLLVTSPIALIMAWVGNLVGCVSAILISPLWSTLAPRLLIYPNAITMMNICGMYYVADIHSFIVGVFACFMTTFLALAMDSWFEVFDLPSSSPLAGYIVIIIMVISQGAFPTLSPVEISSVTTPEDHIRRFWLSRKIFSDMRISHEYHRASTTMIKNTESRLLPILLCAYAKHGFLKQLQSLLNLGADPNACDYDGRCALHIAAAENNMSLVKLLMEKQADVHKTDKFDNNALSSALLNGHYKLAQWLYKRGARLQMDRNHIASSLCYMVAYNDMDRLKIWLNCGADPNTSDYDNRTPLHIAYSKKNDSMIKFLSKYCPKAGKKDRWGQTPQDCYGKTVHDLKPSKDFKKKSLNRRKFLSVDRPCGIDPAIIESVIRSILRSADAEKKQAILPSLICEMVFVKENQLLKDLIKENVINDSNVSDYDNRTALHIACSVGDLNSVKTLVFNNAKVNVIDRFGNSPLLQACKSKHDEVIDFLLDHGARLCLTKEMQVSELCWAVSENDYDMIQRLVNCGIDITAGDYDGRTCLAVAFDNKNKKMLDLLKTWFNYDSASVSTYTESEASSFVAAKADTQLQLENA